MEEFSTSIDYAITENKPLVLMGDYVINCLNKDELEFLETIMIPYGLNVMNEELPTRVVGTSKTLNDYNFTDHLKAETFETHVSDTPFCTSKNKPIDHRATSIISDFQINTKKKVIGKLKKFSIGRITGKIFSVGIWNPATGAGFIAKLASRICSQYSVTS